MYSIILKNSKKAKFTTKSMNRRGENICESFWVTREISRAIDLLLIQENFNLVQSSLINNFNRCQMIETREMSPF